MLNIIDWISKLATSYNACKVAINAYFLSEYSEFISYSVQK